MKEQISRREWLKVGAGTLAITGAAPMASAGGSDAISKNRSVSLAAYSVRKELTSGKMDLFGFIDWCAELDLAGTELTSYYFKENFDTSYLHELRRHAFRKGVIVSGTAVRNNFCLPPGPQKDKEIAHVRKWIDHAAELFAPHIRIFAGDVPKGVDTKTAIQWVADGIKEVLPDAERRGIFLGLENHGGITARAADHLAICDAVGNHPWFGINLDTGNFRTNAYEELEMIAPRAVNVQVKVEIVHHDGSRHPADFERIKRILDQAGYKGWIVLEYEAEADARAAIPKYIKELKALFETC